MYQVFFNQYPLHDLRDEDLILRDPDVHLAVGEAGEMSFTIDSGHPYAGRLTRLKGVVELRTGGSPIFKGRIIKDSQEFDLSREIEVEGLLACLNDSLIPPFNFPDDFLGDSAYQTAAQSGNVVQYFLGWLLDQHNAQVGTQQQIQLGTVTVSDSNNYISRASSEYMTTMEVIRKKLEDLMGGYLVADYSGFVTKLHYYADLPLTNVQTVDFGQNLLDLVTELDGTETYTAILPVGKDGLTIEALPDGVVMDGVKKAGRIVYSETAETAVGGRITRKVDWKDVTEAANLRTKAAAMLSGEGTTTTRTVTVKAIDLGAVEDLPRFTVGRYVRLTSAPHGHADTYPLMELDPDILDPGNTEITIGETIKTSTDIAHQLQSAAQERQDQLQLELNAQKETVTEVAQTFETRITAAVQTSERIILSALQNYVETSNYEEFRSTVESQLKILSDSISLSFTTITEQITDVDGDLQAVRDTLEKHFVFSEDGLTIQAGENSMSLLIDNDLIKFKRNGKEFGWWDGVDFHTGNIVIGVEERAQFGNFAFIPRPNGSLSFLKIGG